MFWYVGPPLYGMNLFYQHENVHALHEHRDDVIQTSADCGIQKCVDVDVWLQNTDQKYELCCIMLQRFDLCIHWVIACV